MSQDRRLHEARRWLLTAEEDLDAARALRDAGKFSHACFHAQQCGEKALKAVWHSLDEDPWGHSVQKLLADILPPAVRERLEAFKEQATLLDRYYIPTRYPNGLPDLTPGQCYLLEDAESCIEAAEKLSAGARAELPGDE